MVLFKYRHFKLYYVATSTLYGRENKPKDMSVEKIWAGENKNEIVKDKDA